MKRNVISAGWQLRLILGQPDCDAYSLISLYGWFGKGPQLMA